MVTVLSVLAASAKSTIKWNGKYNQVSSRYNLRGVDING